MEEAEHDYFRSLGLSIMQRREDGKYIGWPRVSAKFDFKAPLHFEDEFDVHVTMGKVTRSTITWECRITRGETVIGNHYALGYADAWDVVTTTAPRLADLEIRLDGSTRYRWKKRYLDLEELQDREFVSKMIVKFSVLYDTENNLEASAAEAVLSGSSGGISGDLLFSIAQLRNG